EPRGWASAPLAPEGWEGGGRGTPARAQLADRESGLAAAREQRLGRGQDRATGRGGSTVALAERGRHRHGHFYSAVIATRSTPPPPRGARGRGRLHFRPTLHPVTCEAPCAASPRSSPSS